MQPDSLIGLVGNLGAVGFVIWLAHRLTTRTIPDMTETFTAATERQRDDFRAALDAQRKDFTDFTARQSSAHEARLQAVMDKCLGHTSGEH